MLLVEKKYDWLKNRLFFITENVLGILDRLCAELMRRSYDFLSLTLTVVGSTSGSCYFSSTVSMSVGLSFVCFGS